MIDEILKIKREKTLAEAVDFFQGYSFKCSTKKVKNIAIHVARIRIGGMERNTVNLINLFDAMNYNVILLTDEKPHKDDFVYSKNCRRYVLPSKYKTAKRLRSIQKVLEDNEINVYIDNQYLDESMFWDMVMIKMIGIPFVIHIHNIFSLGYKFSLNEYVLNSVRIYKMSDLLLALDRKSAIFFQMNGCKTFLIKNPISINSPSYTRVFQGNRLLLLGRVSPEKGTLNALDIIYEVKKTIPAVHLDIVGDCSGKYGEKVKEKCQKLGLEENVTFAGHNKNVEKYFVSNSLLLMTSKYEGYPLTLIESKAYSMPCVMYDLPFVEMVCEGKGIIKCELNNIEQISKEIIQLLLDQSKYNELCKEAKSSFEELVDYDYSGDWEKIFSICENNMQEQGDKFLDPDNVDFDIRMIVDEYNQELSYGLQRTKDFKIGNLILKIYRYIKR